MRPVANLNVNLEAFPDWFKPQWAAINRMLSDITKILSNGIVLAENMSFQPRTVVTTNDQVVVVDHSLKRNPIVLLAGGRVFWYKVLQRTSNQVRIKVKLPYTITEDLLGGYDKLFVEDGSNFLPGDAVLIGKVVTKIKDVRDNYLVLNDPVVLNGVTRIQLYQESIDLLMF